jgi:hypothetical protein
MTQIHEAQLELLRTQWQEESDARLQEARDEAQSQLDELHKAKCQLEELQKENCQLQGQFIVITASNHFNKFHSSKP